MIFKKNIRIFVISLLTVCTLSRGYAQLEDVIEDERILQKNESFINHNHVIDDRDVVGVAEFKCQYESPYTNLVTEKVVEVLQNTNRFYVVDRTNMDKVNAEMEYQKREEFIGQNVVEQGNNVAAQKMIIGNITKIMVYRIKNADGSVRGYKASVAFELQMQDVATRNITQATSFEGKELKECISPQAAIQMAMNSIVDDLDEYFRMTFPLRAKVVKITAERNGAVECVMIKAGANNDVKVGDRFRVTSIEKLDGEELPLELGNAVVTKLQGEKFSECKIDKKYGKEIFEKFNAGNEIRCTLIIKKK